MKSEFTHFFSGQKHLTSSKVLSTTTIFLFAAPIVILLYGSFVFNPSNADNLILYVMQVIADSIAIMALLGLWVTVLLDVIVEQHHRSHHAPSERFLFTEHPTVDVFITTADEPIEIIRDTIRAVVGMRYPHTTFVLDDGKSPEVRLLAKTWGVNYVVRPDRRHAKAGNLNNGLKYASGEFFVIFDADQVPKEDFLEKLLPYMENKKLAMVQSPQYFANTHSFIAAGTSQAQEVFYKYVCPAKNIY